MTGSRTESTLTDRYVWTVTRHLGADTGPDVARELRGTVRDMVEAKVDAGVDAQVAEEEVLTELGDPDALARQYGGRPGQLIGPGIFPDYVRLMKVLPAVVLPFVLVLSFVGRVATTGDHWAQILLDSFLLLLSVAIHLAFWTTLVFAIIEWSRPESERDRPLTQWSTDRLTSEVPWRQVRLPETIALVVFLLVAIAVVVWQFGGGGEGEGRFQVLDPDLALVWKGVIVALLAADVVGALIVWRVGRWTPTLAVTKVLINVTSTIVLVWLLRQGDLLVADLPRQLADEFGGSADWSVPTAVIAAAIVALTAWDSIDCVLKARRAARPPSGG